MPSVNSYLLLCVEANNMASTYLDWDSNSGSSTPNKSRTDALDHTAMIATLSVNLILYCELVNDN